jgi:hypothetical protein
LDEPGDAGVGQAIAETGHSWGRRCSGRNGHDWGFLLHATVITTSPGRRGL